MRIRHALVVVAVALLPLLIPALGKAAEQRCGELGANCICSEPMQGTIVPRNDIEPGFYTFSDSNGAPKACNYNGPNVAGYTGTSISKTTESLILGALPSGHRVTSVIRQAEGSLGAWGGGGWLSTSHPVARAAVRYYVYYSPSFEFTNESGTTCTNAKIMQVGTSSGSIGIPVSWQGALQTYGWTSGWVNGRDCCGCGPGADCGALPYSSLKGKWWRVEGVISNRSGGDFRLQIFFKNVTDNGPERTMVDTWYTGDSQWGAAPFPNPKETIDLLQHNLFREAVGGGRCRGFHAMTHLVHAAWNTNSGQRIGAAREVEGGVGEVQGGTGQETVPPAAPSGLLIKP